VLDREVSDPPIEAIPRERLREVVKDEYGFRRDTARRYVTELVDAFDLREHPGEPDNILVSEAREQELIDERREQARENINDDVYDSE
jgi:hypothetical protein